MKVYMFEVPVKGTQIFYVHAKNEVEAREKLEDNEIEYEEQAIEVEQIDYCNAQIIDEI